MDSKERNRRLNKLLYRQNKIFVNEYSYSNDSLLLMNNPIEVVKDIEYTDIDFDKELYKINDLTEFDESIFAKWKKADIPVMLIAGILGTFSSVLLKDFFAYIHDNKWSKKNTLSGGHAKENIDWVPGNRQPGGFGHRWQYGHDLLNPFEIDWKQYKDIAMKSGNFLPSWLKSVFYWFKHLFQDFFSKEGLPFPGHSYFRNLFDPVKHREIFQFLGTIKMRDIAGTGVTNLIMSAYLWGTEKDIKRVFIKPNYRAFSLMLGANITMLFSGLLIPPPNTSFNWSSIPIIAYYSIQLIKLEKRVRLELEKREDILNKNSFALAKNDELLSNYYLSNNQNYVRLTEIEQEINNYYNLTMSKHNELKRRLLRKE